MLLSICYLLIEVGQVIRRRQHYFTDGSNYVQVLTFVFSLIFVSGFENKCWCAPSWQWQIGALDLFLAWFNLIIQLKDMPLTGIPINILFNIFFTFLRLVYLPVLLIVSFSLPFYMLFVRDASAFEVRCFYHHEYNSVPDISFSQGDSRLGELTAFASVPRALINTVVKTVGELDFGDIFNQGNLLFPFIAYFLFTMFVIIMPVLFSNLLVS